MGVCEQCGRHFKTNMRVGICGPCNAEAINEIHSTEDVFAFPPECPIVLQRGTATDVYEVVDFLYDTDGRPLLRLRHPSSDGCSCGLSWLSPDLFKALTPAGQEMIDAAEAQVAALFQRYSRY